jgi:hypothetical protein
LDQFQFMGGLRVRFHLNCPDLLVLADIKGLAFRRSIAAFAKQFAARMRKTQQAPSSGLRMQRYIQNGRARTNEVRECGIPSSTSSPLRRCDPHRAQALPHELASQNPVPLKLCRE